MGADNAWQQVPVVDGSQMSATNVESNGRSYSHQMEMFFNPFPLSREGNSCSMVSPSQQEISIGWNLLIMCHPLDEQTILMKGSDLIHTPCGPLDSDQLPCHCRRGVMLWWVSQTISIYHWLSSSSKPYFKLHKFC